MFFRKKKTFKDVMIAAAVALAAVTSSCASVIKSSGPTKAKPAAVAQKAEELINVIKLHEKYWNVVEMEKKPVKFPATPELLAWKKGYDEWR